MNRRLYFVVSDPSHAARLVTELQQADVDPRHIHVLAHDRRALEGLPAATAEQWADRGRTVEHTLWNANLVLFGAGLVALAGLLVVRGVTAWALLPGAVMAATLAAGTRFTHVPNTHLDEFRDALTHGELLVMADAPRTRIADIEDAVRHHQPGVTVGGIGWSTDALRV